MEVVVKVSSSYFEIDTSKYRLAISELTLIESLKQQTDKKFSLILEVSAMDPCHSKRIKAFKSVKANFSLSHEEISSSVPFTVIEVDDDTFLHNELIATVKQMSTSQINRRILAPNGYVFLNSRLQVCSEKIDMLEITQYVQDDRRVRGEILFTRSRAWIHVRHKYNSTLIFDQKTSNDISGLDWPGWQSNILDRYCKMRIAEATANGCQLEPMRSKSVVIASRSKRKRRKRG